MKIIIARYNCITWKTNFNFNLVCVTNFRKYLVSISFKIFYSSSEHLVYDLFFFFLFICLFIYFFFFLHLEGSKDIHVMKLKRTLRKLIENEKLNERNYRNCIVLSAYCGSDYYKRLGRHFCSNCGKEYRWMQSLIRHEKEECGKDPQHSCPVCGTKIRHKWMLKKHLINVHHWVIPNGKNFYLGSTDNSA